ncbi:MAG TPA: PrsW family intramembrane metalloprotease [Bacillota bacterium]
MVYLILLILASFGPGLLWLWYFYRLDRYEPEPLRTIVKFFCGGILLVLPAGLLEQIWRPQLLSSLQQGDWRGYLVMAFLVVAVIEEGLKTGFLWWLIGRDRELNEAVDGVIYGITIGLGFASLENLLWANLYGFGVAALRAVITTLAHASFTGWTGFYIARFKLEASSQPVLIGIGFLVAWASHGLYDFLLFLRHPLASLLGFLLIGILLVQLFKTIHRLVGKSPFKNG